MSIALSKREYAPATEIPSTASISGPCTSTRPPDRAQAGAGVIDFGGDDGDARPNDLDEEDTKAQPTLGLHRAPSAASSSVLVPKRESDVGLQRRDRRAAARLKRETESVKQEPASADAAAGVGVAVKREPIDLTATGGDDEEPQLVKREPMEVEELDMSADTAEEQEPGAPVREEDEHEDSQSPERKRKQRHRDRQPRPSLDPNNERTLFVR